MIHVSVKGEQDERSAPKVCVLQVSNRDDELTSLSKEINRWYAVLNGFDYRFEAFTEGVPFLEAVRHKFIFALKHIDDCDYLCYIDTDAAFSNPNRSLLELVDQETRSMRSSLGRTQGSSGTPSSPSTSRRSSRPT